MVWLNKHTPRLIVCSREEAAEYAQRTRRIGASVTAALTPKGRETGNPGTKLGSGAEKYATYTSPIGEKHHVKD